MKNGTFITLLLLFNINSFLHSQAPIFGNEFHVKINGLTFDAMEPFLSADGNALFFNSLNNGVTTSLYYAAKVNDSTFNMVGAVPVVNQTVTPRLDAVASVDSSNNFYWVSTRNYPSNTENLHRVKFLPSGYTNFGRLHGNFYIPLPGWLIMDAGISYYGEQLIYCNAYFNNCANALPCKASLGIANKLNDSTFNKDSNTTVLMAAVNDTVNYIVYAPALSKDGLELYYTRLLKTSTQTEIMVSTRTNTTLPFATPTLLIGAPYVAPEAPTISSDKNKMYYHRKNGSTYEIYLRYRTGTAGIEENPASSSIKPYPNPTSGKVYVNTTETLHITLCNALGAPLLKTTSDNFDLSDFENGLYFVTISGHNFSKIFKIVRQ